MWFLDVFLLSNVWHFWLREEWSFVDDLGFESVGLDLKFEFVVPVVPVLWLR
jgi:hypothetical protein